MKHQIIILVFIGFIIEFCCGGNKYQIPEFKPCALKACFPTHPNKINVHLIPHSHDDVGWLKTLDEYYYGLYNIDQSVGVEMVIESTLQALKHNPNRRYIQVETAYFWQWWKKASASKRKTFKEFVDSGTIEIVGGGWSMNDEACTNYQSTINQFTWGLRLLNDTLGECSRPKIGWQIDPFGHSREQAWIFKQMGYDAIFFTRLSIDDRNARKLTKDLELMWRSNDNFDNSDIFTSIMDSYYAPKGFVWDYMQGRNDAINDDPDSFDYNLPQKLEDFANYAKTYSNYFKTNNILITMGGDFQYQAAEINYLNIDKLIKGFKNNDTYNVMYSTPSCYLEAVKGANASFIVKKTGDFFPYNENDHVFWAGYYTSRSNLKRYERVGNNILQAAQNLNAFAKMRNIFKHSVYENNLESLREAIGTMQHHDAITGTEKEKVAYDYSRILTEAIRKTENTVGTIIGNILKKENVTENVSLPLTTCLLTNISVCDETVKDRSIIVLYNPLSKGVNYHIRVPVQNGTYKLTGAHGDLNIDLIESIKYPVLYPFNTTGVELLSQCYISPMGLEVLYLQKIAATSTLIKPKIINESLLLINNNDTKVSFNPKSNELTFTEDDDEYVLKQKFMYYISNNGSNDNITSGAYVFRPENGTAAVNFGEAVETMHIKGKYIDEIVQKFGNYVIQILNLRTEGNMSYVEYDWIVGPLDEDFVDYKTQTGREVIARYSIKNFDKTDHFYTDSNGRQMIQRKRNYFPYNNDSVEPVASNYYPVTSRITIKNEDINLQLSVLTDRSQGGSSLKDGEVELMLHRRTLLDDHKGLEETLEEREYGDHIVTRGKHYVISGSTKSTKAERILSLEKLVQPWMLVADATPDELSLESLQKKINFEWSATKNYIVPENIHILTFEPWKDDTFIIRIEHIFDKNEDQELSKKATIELKYLFSPFVMNSIKEVNLAANTFIEGKAIGEFYKIELQPTEIRTFIVTFENISA